MKTSGWERLAFFVLLAGPLIPSLEAGTTPLELAGFVGPLVAGLFLAVAPGHRLRASSAFWLFPALTLSALVALLHETPSYFLSFALGIPIFCLAGYLGATATPERQRILLGVVPQVSLADGVSRVCRRTRERVARGETVSE